MAGFEFKHKIYAKWHNVIPHLVATTKYQQIALCIGEAVSRMTKGECQVRIYHQNNEWYERYYNNGQLDYVKLKADQKNSAKEFWHELMKTHEKVPDSERVSKQEILNFDTSNVICKVEADNSMKPTTRRK